MKREALRNLEAARLEFFRLSSCCHFGKLPKPNHAYDIARDLLKRIGFPALDVGIKLCDCRKKASR